MNWALTGGSDQHQTRSIQFELPTTRREPTSRTYYISDLHYEIVNMADKTPSPLPDMNRNRLPTLFEVLSRRTLPPVDLFSFYIYMRDQQRSVDYLDFWYVFKTLCRICPLDLDNNSLQA